MQVRSRILSGGGLILALLMAAPLFAATCESLRSLKLTNATVTAAVPVPANVSAQKSVPAFCRVAATLRPTSDSEIQMEIWLPSAAWNGKLEANGNGGWSGSISASALTAGVIRGYASAMSNLGHEGASASFAIGHPEKLIDFGYRAAHETTLAAKALVVGFYGRAPALSYWNGCSAGGRSALMEAQRYPNDFDGIVAGSPGLNWTGRAMQSIWIAQAAHQSQASYIPAGKYRLIHDAVLRACDARDGVSDGVLEDPTTCAFDPVELECKGGDGPTCLTGAQVATARAIYSAVTNPRTKEILAAGSERGSEMGWATMAGLGLFRIGADLFRYVVFQNPDWDYRTFDFDAGAARTAKAENGLLNAMDPNLKAFIGHGGKLIQYHGWNDPQISPGSSVAYYKSVLKAMADEKVDAAYRLFMVPGMAHCGGGDGASSFDMLGALEQWVEHGKAPDSIMASRIRDGKVDRTHPLCPYPQFAMYKGTGSTGDGANFACAAVKIENAKPSQ